MNVQFRWIPVGVWDGKAHVRLGEDQAPHVLQVRGHDGGTEWCDVEIFPAAENIPREECPLDIPRFLKAVSDEDAKRGG